MKARLSNIIALFAIIAIGIIACNNDNDTTTHVHDWDMWTITTPATCTSAGEETRTCKLDPTHKETKPIAIDTNAHDWGDWRVTKDPTTTAEGVETRTCKRDATHKDTHAIDKLEDPNQPKERPAERIDFGNNLYTNVSSSKALTDAEWATVKTKLIKAFDSASKSSADAETASTTLFTGLVNMDLVETKEYSYYKFDFGLLKILLNADYVIGATDADLLAKANMAIFANPVQAKAIQPKQNRAHAG
jgi:hypothetical protein